MAGEQTEGESPNTSSQTDQADSPAQAGGEVADALARVQEAVINVKEGGLPEARKLLSRRSILLSAKCRTSQRPISSTPSRTRWRALSRRWRKAKSPISCLSSSRLNR